MRRQKKSKAEETKLKTCKEEEEESRGSNPTQNTKIKQNNTFKSNSINKHKNIQSLVWHTIRCKNYWTKGDRGKNIEGYGRAYPQEHERLK